MIFMLKCLKEVNNDVLVRKICETTVLDDVEEVTNLNEGRFKFSLSDWTAIVFVCRDMRNLVTLRLDMVDTNSLRAAIKMIRQKCITELQLQFRYNKQTNTDIEVVFQAFNEQDCQIEHQHLKLEDFCLINFCVETPCASFIFEKFSTVKMVDTYFA